MKKLIKLLVVLLVIIVIVGVVAVFYVDGIAKAAVQSGASSALGVNTTLEKMDVRLLSGEAGMTGLHVSNPEGFKEDYFLKLAQGDMAVSLGSLVGEKVVVPSVVLTGVRLNVEKDGDKANYQAILDNLKTEEAEPTAEKKGKKYVIENLSIRDIEVHVRMGSSFEDTIKVPDIELKNIGSDSDNGVVMSELTGVMTKTILTHVVASAGQLPGAIAEGLAGGLQDLTALGGDIAEQMGGEAQKIIEGMGDITGGLGEGAGAVGEEAGKTLEGAGEKVKEGLGGLGDLLGGDKDKEGE